MVQPEELEPRTKRGNAPRGGHGAEPAHASAAAPERVPLPGCEGFPARPHPHWKIRRTCEQICAKSGKPSSPERFRDFLPFLTHRRVWSEPRCHSHLFPSAFVDPSESCQINPKEGTTSLTSSSTSPPCVANVPREAPLPGDRCAAQPGSFHPHLNSPSSTWQPVFVQIGTTCLHLDASSECPRVLKPYQTVFPCKESSPGPPKCTRTAAGHNPAVAAKYMSSEISLRCVASWGKT